MFGTELSSIPWAASHALAGGRPYAVEATQNFCRYRTAGRAIGIRASPMAEAWRLGAPSGTRIQPRGTRRYRNSRSARAPEGRGPRGARQSNFPSNTASQLTLPVPIRVQICPQQGDGGHQADPLRIAASSSGNRLLCCIASRLRAY